MPLTDECKVKYSSDETFPTTALPCQEIFHLLNFYLSYSPKRVQQTYPFRLQLKEKIRCIIQPASSMASSSCYYCSHIWFAHLEAVLNSPALSTRIKCFICLMSGLVFAIHCSEGHIPVIARLCHMYASRATSKNLPADTGIIPGNSLLSLAEIRNSQELYWAEHMMYHSLAEQHTFRDTTVI